MPKTTLNVSLTFPVDVDTESASAIPSMENISKDLCCIFYNEEGHTFFTDLLRHALGELMKEVMCEAVIREFVTLNGWVTTPNPDGSHHAVAYDIGNEWKKLTSVECRFEPCNVSVNAA